MKFLNFFINQIISMGNLDSKYACTPTKQLNVVLPQPSAPPLEEDPQIEQIKYPANTITNIVISKEEIKIKEKEIEIQEKEQKVQEKENELVNRQRLIEEKEKKYLELQIKQNKSEYKEKRQEPGWFYIFNSNYKTNLLLQSLNRGSILNNNFKELLSEPNKAIVDRRHVYYIIFNRHYYEIYILENASNKEFLIGLNKVLSNSYASIDANREQIITAGFKDRSLSEPEKKFLARIIYKHENNFYIRSLTKYL